MNNNLDLSCKIDETLYYNPYMHVKKTRESYVWFDNDKRKFIDFLMGYSSTNFGHSNPYITNCIKKIVDKYDNLPAFNSYDRVQLDEKIISRIRSCKKYKTYYTVGGAKAVDGAIKLARASTQKKIIITFEGAFHGYSYCAMALTDNKFVDKKSFFVDSDNIITFPFPNINQDSICNSIINSLENFIDQNSNNIAGIIYEPIQCAAGFIQAPINFLQSIQAIANKYGILTICDEIQTCMGRFGSFIYINKINLEPDIILIGKSLAGGYYPLSVIIATEKIFNSINPEKSGFGSTFSNNLFGISIANCVIDLLTEELYKSIELKGIFLKDKMMRLSKHDIIGKMNFIGLSCSIQIAENYNNSSKKLATRIRNESFCNGLILQTAGVTGDYLKISPSFYVSEQTIEEGLKRLERALQNIRKDNT